MNKNYLELVKLLFVSRENIIDDFDRVIQSTSTAHALNVFGEGGIGKSWVLFLLYSETGGIFIDLDNIALREIDGLQNYIVSVIGREAFNKYNEERKRYIRYHKMYQTGDIAKSLFERQKDVVNDTFIECCKRAGRKVFYFDSWDQISNTETASWLRTQLIPRVPRFRFCIAGRSPMPDTEGIIVKKLSPIPISGLIEYARRKCGGSFSVKEMEEADFKKIIDSLQGLVGEVPILFDLGIEWVMSMRTQRKKNPGEILRRLGEFDKKSFEAEILDNTEWMSLILFDTKKYASAIRQVLRCLAYCNQRFDEVLQQDLIRAGILDKAITPDVIKKLPNLLMVRQPALLVNSFRADRVQLKLHDRIQEYYLREIYNG